jgi:ribosomal protein S24E
VDGRCKLGRDWDERRDRPPSGLLIFFPSCSDILHPGRANISKEELRDKLAGLYKANKEQVSVFGLRTQFGGGKTTGFALVYDSPEAMKKFEPHYRLVRVGLATKIERASRQQRMSNSSRWEPGICGAQQLTFSLFSPYRQAAQEQAEDSPGYGEGQGCQGEEGEINGWRFVLRHLLHRVSIIRDGQWLRLCALHFGMQLCIRQST